MLSDEEREEIEEEPLATPPSSIKMKPFNENL